MKTAPEEDAEVDGLRLRAEHDGVQGRRCLGRIRVEPARHDARAARPSFVRTGSPEDRAHGFDAGDLHGPYSVFTLDRPRRTDRIEPLRDR